MGTCGCHWARGRREAPAAKVAAGGRMPLARHTLRADGCRRTGRAYAPLHCSLAAALTVMGLRHRPQSGSCRDCDTQLLLPSVRKALRTLNRGKICAPCMIRGVCAAKGVPSWQDIHVVYPPTAICRAFRIHGAQILPKPAHFEYTAAIYCHEGAFFPSEAFFGGTSGQNIAIVRHLGTHNVNISPPPGAWECISWARGNAVGCRQHRLRGQLRCKSTDEPVHSNIFPLRY